MSLSFTVFENLHSFDKNLRSQSLQNTPRRLTAIFLHANTSIQPTFYKQFANHIRNVWLGERPNILTGLRDHDITQFDSCLSSGSWHFTCSTSVENSKSLALAISEIFYVDHNFKMSHAFRARPTIKPYLRKWLFRNTWKADARKFNGGVNRCT